MSHAHYGRRAEDDDWWPRFKRAFSANKAAVLASAFFLMLGAAGSRIAMDIWGAPARANAAYARTVAIIEDSLPALRESFRDQTNNLRDQMDQRFDSASREREAMLDILKDINCRQRGLTDAQCRREDLDEITGG